MRTLTRIAAFLTIIGIMTFGQIVPGFAFAYPCPASGVAQCKAMNVTGTNANTCQTWVCVGDPPVGAAGTSLQAHPYHCAQSNAKDNTACGNKNSCTIYGICKSGVCVAEKILQCSLTKNAPSGVICSCLGGKCQDLALQNDTKYCVGTQVKVP